ncbi:MAG: DUF4249 domain-containing protein [Chitinophagales bacterium]|nr:DUF4249 domain-containing protein [Chitinophagales bacterium]
MNLKYYKLCSITYWKLNISLVLFCCVKILGSWPAPSLNHPNKRFFIFCFSVLLISSCQKDITLNIPPSEEQIVVEGHIETGQPPYVILTRTSDYYSTFYLDSLSNLFVHDAVVQVSDGTQTITLSEFSLDTLGAVVSVYLGLNMVGEVGKTYTLTVQTEGKTLNAVTTIPNVIPLDSIWYEQNADPDNDTLVRLICRYNDPPQLGQYVRYFTQINNEGFYPGLNSVFEDAVINGTTFDFPLDRGINRNDSTSFENYGLFKKGDTITVKWSGIDKPHFDYWRTEEFELGGQGSPFSSPVIIQSNINGGLGIWGGYSSSFISIVVPK